MLGVARRGQRRVRKSDCGVSFVPLVSGGRAIVNRNPAELDVESPARCLAAPVSNAHPFENAG
jgi:hypothetical protein